MYALPKTQTEKTQMLPFVALSALFGLNLWIQHAGLIYFSLMEELLAREDCHPLYRQRSRES